MIKIFGTALSLASLNIFANAFFMVNDAMAGKFLVEKLCISRHASSCGSESSAIVTHETNIVEPSKDLIAQARKYNTNFGLIWFDYEKLNVANYLNEMY